jgi:hypothetical protein
VPNPRWRTQQANRRERTRQFPSGPSTTRLAEAFLDNAGPAFPYVWRWRTMQDPWKPPGKRCAHPLRGRVGQRCRVLARGNMNSALLEFEDGFRTVASRNAIRKA